MSTDWLGPRIYRPSLEEVLRGALSASTPTVHYITHFRYPTQGGFVAYLKKFVPMGNLRLNHELTSIDPRAHELRFSNGTVANYDVLVSSVPLPDLVRMIQGTPQYVLDAAARLACSTCVLVNVGVDREDLSSHHLTYIYDEDICFTRLSFPHMFTRNNSPAGTGSIQAEVYFSDKYKPMTGKPEDCIEPVIADLRRCGLLRDSDRVVFREARLLRYANIIFDLERAEALKKVHAYLDDLGIAYCGRYGDWGYLWTDESFKSGEKAAERALVSCAV
jgi:protoporphyrinogen oxidase